MTDQKAPLRLEARVASTPTRASTGAVAFRASTPAPPGSEHQHDLHHVRTHGRLADEAERLAKGTRVVLRGWLTYHGSGATRIIVADITAFPEHWNTSP